jgi:hypothetical protein
MTQSEHTSPLIERCWLCDGRILRGDRTRIVPGLGLKVHSRCYELDTEPPGPSPSASAA